MKNRPILIFLFLTLYACSQNIENVLFKNLDYENRSVKIELSNGISFDLGYSWDVLSNNTRIILEEYVDKVMAVLLIIIPRFHLLQICIIEIMK